MNHQKKLELMRDMRLHGMYDAMQGLVQSKKLNSINADQLLALLLQQQWDERNNRKINRLMRSARFRYSASLQEIKADSKRNLSGEQLAIADAILDRIVSNAHRIELTVESLRKRK